LELKVVVTLLALYSKCSMFCAQTSKHPIVRLVEVFLSTAGIYSRIWTSILP